MLAEEKRKGNQHGGSSLPLWGASESGRPAPGCPDYDSASGGTGGGGESTLGERRMGMGREVWGQQLVGCRVLRSSHCKSRRLRR
jgi:hypothetical protein